MGFLSAILDEFLGPLDGAGFFEHVFIILIFGISASVVVGLLYAAVVLLLVALYDWWCGTGGDAATVPAGGELEVRQPVVAEAALLVGNELGARTVRRRTVRDTATGEAVSYSGAAIEHERE